MALSDPVHLALLERLVPLAAIERLEARGLLDVFRGDDGLELRLNHPLYGEVVRAQLPQLRWIRLSRALADAADGDHDAPVHDALRAAVWRLDGGGGGQVEATQAAARSALRMEDYSLAVRLGRSVWERAPSVEAAIILGEALDFLGRSREAEEVLETASVMATNDRQRTKLTVRRAAALFRSLGEADRANAVIDETMASVTDPSCRRELQALAGNHLLLMGDVARSVPLGQELLEIPGDAAFAQASLDVGTGLALAGRTREALDHVDAALSARLDLDDEEQLSAIGVYLVAQSLAHLHAGNLAQALAIADAGYRVSVEKSNADGQAWFASMLGVIHLEEGRPVTSMNMFRESATLFGTLNHPARRWGLAGIALAAACLGDADVGTAAIAELDDAAPTAVHLQEGNIIRARAWVAFVRGEQSLARDLLFEAVEVAERCGQYAAASAALFDLARIGPAAPVAERLAQMGEAVDGAFMLARISFALAAHRDDVELARTAADQFESIGAKLLAAEASMLEAHVADGGGLRRRAAEAEARAERLLASCEGAHIPAGRPVRGAAVLTDREREVATLAAQGLSSREIADGLFLSVRTVDNHLQQVYVKLGVKRRRELAAHLSAP